MAFSWLRALNMVSRCEIGIPTYVNRTACPFTFTFTFTPASQFYIYLLWVNFCLLFSIVLSPLLWNLREASLRALLDTPRQHHINHPDTSHLRCFALNTLNTGHRPLGGSRGQQGRNSLRNLLKQYHNSQHKGNNATDNCLSLHQCAMLENYISAFILSSNWSHIWCDYLDLNKCCYN